MKREITAVTAMIVMMAVLLLPLAGGVMTTAETTMTTTTWMTTTTTGWDCISTPPPTTTTSWVLTGPDGTAPTTTVPTTEPVSSACGNTKDLLSDAAITVSDTMAILGSPAGGHWLSVDCYSYDGGTVSIVPPLYNTNIQYYLHITLIANVPFSFEIRDSYRVCDDLSWFPESAIREDGLIEAGTYTIVNDVSMVWDALNCIEYIGITLSAPGSLTVGHIVLSDEDVCCDEAPKIQTTTRPSFPWDETTFPPTTTTTWVLTGTSPTTFPTTTAPITTTVTTTNPTTGDALIPGDVDGDGWVSSSDARVILAFCLENGVLGGDGDFNGDGVVSTNDVRAILMMLTA